MAAKKDLLKKSATAKPEKKTQVDLVIPEPEKPAAAADPEEKPEAKTAAKNDKLVLSFSGKNKSGAVTEGRKKYLEIMSRREHTKITPYIMQLIDDDMKRNARIYEEEKRALQDALLDELERLRKNI